MARLPLGTLGSASHYLGLLAATIGRWNDAVVHFRNAIDIHERLRAAPLLERSRHHHAQALRAMSGKHSDNTAE